MLLKTAKRGIFDSLKGAWWEEKRRLHHNDLDNAFKSIVDPGMEKLTEEILHGHYDNPDSLRSLDIKEVRQIASLKERIVKWDALKTELIDHARKAMTEFDPYLSGFSLLATMPQGDKAWLHAALKDEASKKYRINEWISAVELAVDKVDAELTKVRDRKEPIKDLGSAIKKLSELFAGKGYFYA